MQITCFYSNCITNVYICIKYRYVDIIHEFMQTIVNKRKETRPQQKINLNDISYWSHVNHS